MANDGLSIIQGLVKVRREVNQIRAELVGVETTGSTIELDGARHCEINQLLIVCETGPIDYDIFIYSDSLETDEVMLYEVNGEPRAYMNKMGVTYYNTDSPTVTDKIYLKLVPKSGTNHSFKIRLFYERLW